jgi:hypothetical protein
MDGYEEGMGDDDDEVRVRMMTETMGKVRMESMDRVAVGDRRGVGMERDERQRRDGMRNG